jgi:putative salt-induced outer membrane protein YdiY
MKPSNHCGAACCAALVTVAGLTAALHADELLLRSGDRLTGTIVERGADLVILDHEVLGRMEVPVDELISSGMSDAQRDLYYHTALAALQDVAEKEWKSHIEFGAGGSFGNSDTQNLNAAFHTKREDDDDATTIDAKYFFGTSDGDRTDNRFSADILQDWFFPDSPWLFFATGRYDYDEFNSWEHRVSAFGGFGYQLIKEDDKDLTLRAGLGASQEFNSPDEDLNFEALLGFDFNWTISEKQTFHLDSTIYPQLDDPSMYRTLTNANWAVVVDESSNLSLTVGVQHEYQSDVAAGVEHNDLRVTAGLRFDF